MGKIVKFDSSNRNWIEKYGNRFCFVEDFLLDDTGNVNELAEALDTTPEEIMNNSAIKITPKKIIVKHGVPIELLGMRKSDVGLPLVSVNGLKFELISFEGDKYPVKVEILD